MQSVVNEKGHNEGEDTPVSRHLTLRDLWQGLVTDGLISQVRPLCVSEWVGVRAVRWLAGWWLAVCLVDWLIGWLSVWLVDWLVGWLAGWLAGRLAGWLAVFGYSPA